MNMKFLLPLILSASAVLAQTTLAPLPPDGFVTLQQITQEFTQHPNAATQKYNGMRITVYGRVGHLSKSEGMAGNPLVVHLQLPNNSTPDVKCVFTPDEVTPGQGNVEISEDHQQATIFHRNGDGELTRHSAFMTVGDMVGIRGTFSDFEVGEIKLKDCRRVPKEKLDNLVQQHSGQ